MHKLIATLLLVCASAAWAGAQKEEQLSSSVKALMQKSISDDAAPRLVFANDADGLVWLTDMSRRLQQKMPDPQLRMDFLRTVNYEASRAGLDPQLVLGLIQVESGFKKYAVSPVGARGFMQVMPFWPRSLGVENRLFGNVEFNVRLGCEILAFYMLHERNDYRRALARYNGSTGRREYPDLVLGRLSSRWRG